MRQILSVAFSASIGFLVSSILLSLFPSFGTLWFLIVLVGVGTGVTSASIISGSLLNKKFGNVGFARIFHIFILLSIGLSIILSIWDSQLRVPMIMLTLSAFLLWYFTGGCPFTHFEVSLRKEKDEVSKQLQNGGLIGLLLKYWFGLNFSGRQIEKGLYIIAIILFSWYAVDVFI